MVKTTDPDLIKKLEDDFKAASISVARGVVGKQSRGLENRYGVAYRSLERVGLRSHLKKKYNPF